MDSDRHVVQAQESELYVLSSIVKFITPNQSAISILASDFIIRFEQKGLGSEILNDLKDEIEEHIKDLKISTPISFFDKNN